MIHFQSLDSKTMKEIIKKQEIESLNIVELILKSINSNFSDLDKKIQTEMGYALVTNVLIKFIEIISTSSDVIDKPEFKKMLLKNLYSNAMNYFDSGVSESIMEELENGR